MMLIIDTVAAITTMHVICIVIVPIKKFNYPLNLDDDVFTLLQCPSDTINKAKFMKYTGLGTFLFAFYTLTCYKCYPTNISFQSRRARVKMRSLWPTNPAGSISRGTTAPSANLEASSAVLLWKRLPPLYLYLRLYL